MRTVLLAFLIASSALAQSVKMPPAVKLDPAVGLPVSVTIEWEGDDVSWTEKLSDDIVVFREHSSDPKVVRLMVFVARGAKEATYNLNAAACKDKKMSPFGTTKVVVGKGDNPKPPDPDPTPVTPLGKAFKDALAACEESDKVDRVKKLAVLYRKAGDAIVKSEKVKTVADLFTALTGMYEELGVNKTVKPVLAVINAELAKVLPVKADDPYGDPARLTALFQKISDALTESVK